MGNRRSKSDQALIDQFEGERLYREASEDAADRKKTYDRLNLLWTRRRLLGKFALCGLAFSLAVAFLIPTEYQATTRLMPPDQGSGSGIEAIASMAGGGTSSALAGLTGLLGAKASGDLFLGVLASQTVQDDLITKFDLRKVYGKNRREDARKKLDSRTKLSVDKKSELLEIGVTDKDPVRATNMAREYVDELNRVMAQLNTSASHLERVFLEDRLVEVKQDLEGAEQQFSRFASANVALDVPEQGKAMLEASSQLQGQLIAAQTELQGLRQIYTDNNVRVRTTQARIDELHHQIEKLRGDSGPTDESGTTAAGALAYPSIRKLPQLGVSYADLVRTTKVDEAVFEALTQQYEAAKVDEAKDLPTVKVLDEAQVPEKKSFPPRAVITFAGGLLAIGLGVAWILGEECWRNVDPEDPAKSFARKVAADLAHDLPWLSRNGVATEAATNESGHPPLYGPNGNGNSTS
jgi:uncharacterized protein involved in exopolysaccharide biosynthesis